MVLYSLMMLGNSSDSISHTVRRINKRYTHNNSSPMKNYVSLSGQYLTISMR